MLYYKVCFFNEFRFTNSEEEQPLHAHHHEAPDKGIHPDQHVTESHHRRSARPKSDWEIFWKTLGENIERRRKRRKWSQAKLAGKAGLSIETVKRVESAQGEASVDTLDRIARVLQFPISIRGIVRH